MTAFQVFRMILVYDYIKMMKQSSVDYYKKNSWKKKNTYDEIILKVSKIFEES